MLNIIIIQTKALWNFRQRKDQVWATMVKGCLGCEVRFKLSWKGQGKIFERWDSRKFIIITKTGRKWPLHGMWLPLQVTWGGKNLYIYAESYFFPRPPQKEADPEALRLSPTVGEGTSARNSMSGHGSLWKAASKLYNVQGTVLHFHLVNWTLTSPIQTVAGEDEVWITRNKTSNLPTLLILGQAREQIPRHSPW